MPCILENLELAGCKQDENLVRPILALINFILYHSIPYIYTHTQNLLSSNSSYNNMSETSTVNVYNGPSSRDVTTVPLQC